MRNSISLSVLAITAIFSVGDMNAAAFTFTLTLGPATSNYNGAVYGARTFSFTVPSIPTVVPGGSYEFVNGQFGADFSAAKLDDGFTLPETDVVINTFMGINYAEFLYLANLAHVLPDGAVGGFQLTVPLGAGASLAPGTYVGVGDTGFGARFQASCVGGCSMRESLISTTESLTIAATPEPASVGLISSGLLALTLLFRERTNK